MLSSGNYRFKSAWFSSGKRKVSIERCHITHCQNKAMLCSLQKMLIYKINQHEQHLHQPSLISPSQSSHFATTHTRCTTEQMWLIWDVAIWQITAGVYLPWQEQCKQKNSGRRRRKGSFDKCVMGKKLIRRGGCQLWLHLWQTVWDRTRQNGRGIWLDCTGLWQLDGYQPVSILCFFFLLFETGNRGLKEEFFQRVTGDIICMFPEDSVTETG